MRRKTDIKLRTCGPPALYYVTFVLGDLSRKRSNFKCLDLGLSTSFYLLNIKRVNSAKKSTRAESRTRTCDAQHRYQLESQSLRPLGHGTLLPESGLTASNKPFPKQQPVVIQ